jgi:hypothetical protein
MAGRTELQGSEVIRLHRLMKNSVTAATGIRAYALVTEQAANAIDLPDFFAAATRHVEHTGEFGDTVCYVYDLAPIFALWHASRRIVVQADEPLAFEPMECDLPVPPAVAWAYVTDVEKKIRWQQGLDGMTMTGFARGRIAPGSTQHCAHGKSSTIHDIVDWRPFDYVTYHIRTPLGTVVRQMAEFTPLENGGTHLSLRCAKPEGGNPVTTALVRAITRLAMAKKLVREQRASKVALERLVAEDLAASVAAGEGTAV